MKAGQVKLLIQETLGIPADQQAQNIGPKTRAAFERLAQTPNDQEWNTEPAGGFGIYRTDWRGYREVDKEKLKAYMPDGADFLIPFFLDNAKRYNVNPLFLIAISKHETGNWQSSAFRTKANAMGISSSRGVISQENYNQSIRTAAFSLTKPGGYYRNAKTIADVGAVYAPANASNDPMDLNKYWAPRVTAYFEELEKNVA